VPATDLDNEVTAPGSGTSRRTPSAGSSPASSGEPPWPRPVLHPPVLRHPG